MSDTHPYNDLDYLARRRAGRKIGWYVHALVFLAVNTGLAFLSYYNGRHFVLGSAFGWGLGLLLHGLFVFVLPTGGAWRERLVQRERERLLREREK
jgi:hypothetical protein